MGSLLELIFPAGCASCGGAGWPLCRSCTERVGVIVPPWCERCGRPSEEPLRWCADCPPRAIGSVRAPFLYEGPMARAIKGMKFSGWSALAAHLGGAVAEMCRGDQDAVTWVPLSARRRARRGFDQAEELARAVARRLAAPLRPLLRRERETRAQARRSGAERRRALEGAFRATGPVPRRVLLVDDVLTTGATAAACADALRDAGAVRVDVAVAARSLGTPVPARCRPGTRDGRRTAVPVR